jgi:hypothetical protein
MGSIWKRAAVLLACIAALAATAAPAGAAGWTTSQLQGDAGQYFLLNVDCPTTGFCAATGTQNLIATSTDPTGGGAAWHTVYAGEGRFEPPDGGLALTSRQVQGISCPSTRLCVAVTTLGQVYTNADPTDPASAWNDAELKPTGENIHLYGVSCPTESLCVAVSGRRINTGKVFTSTDPTGGPAAWHETDLGEGLDLRAVSCSAATFCVAAGAGGELLVSRDPTGGPGAWSVVGAPGGSGTQQSIDCVTGLCLTGNAGGTLLTATEPATLASWHGVNGGSSVQITGSACVSTEACLAVDNNGDAIVSNAPAGPHPAWSLTSLRPYSAGAETPGSPEGNGLFGASCPSLELCVLVGARGAILTSTEPFAAAAQPTPGTATTPGTNGKRKPKRGPKRPRAVIARVQLDSRGENPGFTPPRHAKLLLRFHAARGPVRRFECRLDKRGFRPCHSPKRWPKIGRGVHSVSIRAVGTSGMRGPIAREKFYVGRICRGGSCVTGAGTFPHGSGWKFG